MAKYRIVLLPGDGVGNDVMEAAQIILTAAQLDAEYIKGDIGWEFWKTEGNPLPDRTLDLLRKSDCALFGAITSKPKSEADEELSPSLRGKGYVYTSPIVRLRQEFNLHTNLRPCTAYPRNLLNHRENIDIVIFRENTEGMYAGVEFYPFEGKVREVLMTYSSKMRKFENVQPHDLAITCRIITRKGSANIVRQAFEYAKKHGYKDVTLVEKPNVLRETSGLMVRVAREVAREYPGIPLKEANVDAMAMWLIKNPEQYGVIVTSNLFGDILSDLCAQLVGGLGFASSGNIGDRYAVFEPTHGSAPKYAGMYKVNPIAMILSVKLMFDYLQEPKLAQKLEHAVATVINEGKIRTYDMGGSNTTIEMAQAIAKELKS